MGKIVINKILLIKSFSLILFILWPLGGALFSFYQVVRNRNFTFYATIVIIFFGLYGYCYNVDPSTDVDLVRIYNIFEILKDLHFKEALPVFLFNGDFSYLLYWVLAHLNFKAQVIGFLSSALIYGSILIVNHKILLIFNKRQYGFLYVSWFFLMVLCIHPLLISGVRTSIGLAFCLLSIGYYFDEIQWKSNLFILMSVFIHFMFLPIAVLFFISKYCSQPIKKTVIIAFIVLTFFYFPIMHIISNFFTKMGTIGALMGEKIIEYTYNWDTQNNLVGLTAGSRIWLAQPFVLFVILTLLHFDKQFNILRRESSSFVKLYSFVILLISFSIFNIYNLVALGRLITVLVLIILILIMILKIILRDNYFNKLLLIFYFSVPLIAIIAFIQEYYNMDVYKILFKNTTKLLSGNIFTILQLEIDYKF